MNGIKPHNIIICTNTTVEYFSTFLRIFPSTSTTASTNIMYWRDNALLVSFIFVFILMRFIKFYLTFFAFAQTMLLKTFYQMILFTILVCTIFCQTIMKITAKVHLFYCWIEIQEQTKENENVVFDDFVNDNLQQLLLEVYDRIKTYIYFRYLKYFLYVSRIFLMP